MVEYYQKFIIKNNQNLIIVNYFLNKINVLKNNHGNKNLKRNVKILKGKNYYD